MRQRREKKEYGILSKIMGNGVSKTVSRTPLKGSWIAAIDFGTVNTGVLICDTESDAFYRVFSEDRLPSRILLDNEKQINSFGYDALCTYSQLSKEKRQQWYFYQHQKLQLIRSKHFRKDLNVKAVNTTKTMSWLELMKKVIEHLRSESDERLRIAAKTDDLYWTITVPVNFSYDKRELMREAAYNAGIRRDKLRLVTEAEAAAFSALKSLLKNKKRGFKYILADLGGGTVDICAHEKLKGGKVREIYPKLGKTCGGHLVNENFEKFIACLVGENVWAEFIKNYPDLYIGMLDSFEDQKKGFKMKTETVMIRLEAALLQELQKASHGKITFAELAKRSDHVSLLKFEEDTNNLYLDSKLMRQFFEVTITGIIEAIQEVQNNCKCFGNTIILSGGFSESPYLKQRLINQFRNSTVLSEIDAHNSVMKGAILIRKADENVIERLAKYSYGFATTQDCKKSFFDKNASGMTDKKVFNTIIKIGETLKHGASFTKRSSLFTYTNPSGDMVTEFYRSDSKTPPKYCDESGCKLLSSLSIKTPKDGWQRNHKFDYEVSVEDIELNVKIKYVKFDNEKTNLDTYG